MPMMRRFEGEGVLALRPQAFLMLFRETERPEIETIGEDAIVCVRGPLVHHRGWWDSYEEIVDRVAAACESSAKRIILKIDSPGGELYGCFDAVRAIRAKCLTADKPLVAYVEGDACSAAYALACAAGKIVVGETSFVGSIGVMETRTDVTASDSQWGTKYAIVTSGARKADRHPHVPINDAELAATQGRVESLANVFFELVASMRTGLTVDAVRALDADVFHGPAAIKAGLADEVASFDALLASAGGGETMGAEADSKDIDTAREALERAAEGDDADAEKAKAALKALDGPGEEEEGDQDPAASSEEGDEEPGKEAGARSPAPGAAATAVDLAATVQRLSARVEQLETTSDAGRKAALFASRPDLSKELVATLKTTPFALAKKIVAGIPVKASGKPAAAASASPVRGQGQGDPSSSIEDGDDDERSPDDHRPWRAAEIDKRMGLGASANPIKVQGTRKVFGIMTPKEAAERTAKQAAARSAGKGQA